MPSKIHTTLTVSGPNDAKQIESRLTETLSIYAGKYDTVKENTYFFDLIDYPKGIKQLMDEFPDTLFEFVFAPEVMLCKPVCDLSFKGGKCVYAHQRHTELLDDDGNEEDYIEDNDECYFDLDSVDRAFGLS